MLINSRDRNTKVLLHLLTWALIILILFIYPPSKQKQSILPHEFLIKQIVHILLMFAAYYLNAYVLVPRLLFNNKFAWYACALVLLLLFSSFSLNILDSYLGLSAQLAIVLGKKNWTNPYIDSFGLLTTLFVIGISTSIAIISKWNKERLDASNQEGEKVRTELSFLRAQIQPHFFFNTLNTIYALTYTDVEASRKVLNKLSRMMRYLLYETHQIKVPLEKEIAFVRDYVGIMLLRVNENTHIDFLLPDDTKDMQIAPMLFLPYVENAFKHGMNDRIQVTIKIHINLVQDKIELTTENKINTNRSEITDNNNLKGIGMANTLRRLDLLYANVYSLTTNIDDLQNSYTLNLSLKLT